MKVIGITGGVGAGKSTVLSILNKLTKCVTIMADDVAKELMVTNENVINAAYDIFGPEAYDDNGVLNKALLASKIYESDEIRMRWNGVIHPATNEEIFRRIDEARASGQYDYVFIEAALLIENHYDEICDELWYVRASADTRIARLMASRGYTREKCLDIIASQMSDEEFLAHCAYVINTEKSIEIISSALQNKLEE